MSGELLELSAAELLERLASPLPTPGGGSAAALAGALAAALVTMVAIMPRTRTGAEEERRTLDGVRSAAAETGARLRALVDDDARAYDAVLAARRLPKGTEEEKAGRAAAVEAALAHAAEVPLQTARACLAVLGLAAEALAHGNPNAHSDARTAGALAWAGLMSAVENVRINLEGQSGHAAVQEARAAARAGQERLKSFGLGTV